MSGSWPLVPLREVLRQHQEYIEAPEPRLYPKLSVKLYGKGVYLDTPADGATMRMKRHQIAKTGQVILSEIWGKKGAIGFVPPGGDGALCTSHFFLFDVLQDRIEPGYLQAIFTANYLQDQLDAEAKGTTGYAAVRPNHLLSARIPLPSLEEQRRIVARVQELAAKIDEARGVRRQVVEETDALIQVTVRKLLAGVNAPVTQLSSWLDQNRDGIQTGPFGAQLGSGDFIESGVPVLTIGNVQYSGLRLGNLKYVSAEKARQLDRYAIGAGDILFARMGTVGRCCVVPRDCEGWLINYHIIRVALDKPRVEPRYVHWTIRASSEVEAYLDEKIRGATRQGVNSAIVGGLPCRVPPMTEQRRIVAYLDDLQAKVDSLKKPQAETAAELDAMLPSILDKAFKGEL
jgi:type I restriction enzyme S subunit